MTFPHSVKELQSRHHYPEFNGLVQLDPETTKQLKIFLIGFLVQTNKILNELPSIILFHKLYSSDNIDETWIFIFPASNSVEILLI